MDEIDLLLTEIRERFEALQTPSDVDIRDQHRRGIGILCDALNLHALYTD